MRKTIRGFTIVELIVVIVVIGILATIGVISYSGIQTKTRNSQRASSTSIIANALEKYYSKNGEYPSCNSLIASNVTINTLFGIDPAVLIAPGAANGSTNSISCSTNTIVSDAIGMINAENNNAATNKFTYICLGVTISNPCTQYSLGYKEETTNNPKFTDSIHKVIAGLNIPVNLLTVSLGSADGITVQSSITTNTLSCGANTLQYRSSSTSSDGTNWSNYNDWSTNLSSYFAPITVGTTYRYQIQAHCINYNQVSDNIESSSNYTATISAPAVAPAIATTFNSVSNTVVGTITTPVTCAAGNPQYQINNIINDAPGTWSTWSTTTTSQAANDGVKYTHQAQARCILGSITSTTVTGTVSSAYIDPITQPVAPTVSKSTTGSITTYSWTAASCPTNTTARYRYDYVIDYSPTYTSSWYAPQATTSSTYTYDTSSPSEGYKYVINVQSQCYNSNYTPASWSSSGTTSYIRPVQSPGTITYGITTFSSSLINISATSSCTDGSLLYSRMDLYIGGGWEWTDTGYGGWYSDHNGGVWLSDDWLYYGDTISLTTDRASGIPFRAKVEMRCQNYETSRTSSSTGVQFSPTFYSP